MGNTFQDAWWSRCWDILYRSHGAVAAYYDPPEKSAAGNASCEIIIEPGGSVGMITRGFEDHAQRTVVAHVKAFAKTLEPGGYFVVQDGDTWEVMGKPVDKGGGWEVELRLGAPVRFGKRAR